MVEGREVEVATSVALLTSLRHSEGIGRPALPPPLLRPKRSLDASPASRLDPLSVLGDDLCLAHVFPLLDAAALASCAAVSRRWRSLACSSCLWLPLLDPLLASRAHIPLPILRSRSPLHPHTAVSITMRDAAQVRLSPSEMCARIWEMRVKPVWALPPDFNLADVIRPLRSSSRGVSASILQTCGPYWYSLDPTTRGEKPLLRRFQCDHSITPMQENDPIWGGQESVWKFVIAETPRRNFIRQLVQINSWPHHHVFHMPDGRWRLENEYASYTTCPDQECNRPPYLVGKSVGFCPRCNPKPTEKRAEQLL